MRTATIADLHSHGFSSNLCPVPRQVMPNMTRDFGVDRIVEVSDGRRIRQWLSGDRPIPDGIWKDIARLLTERKSVIDDALCDLLKIIPTNT